MDLLFYTGTLQKSPHCCSGNSNVTPISTHCCPNQNTDECLPAYAVRTFHSHSSRLKTGLVSSKISELHEVFLSIKYAQKIDYVAEETPDKIQNNGYIT